MNAPLSVTIPDGAKIHLSVIGEEDTPVDLTPYVADLLRSYATLSDAVRAHRDIDNEVDFATISADDNIEFTCNGEPVDQVIGLRALSDMIVVAMITALRSEDTQPFD